MRAAGRKPWVRWAMVLAAGMLAASRPLGSPALLLNPSFGPPGASVSATGTGFTPGVDVSLLWDGTDPVGGGTVGADGAVVMTFHVPADAAPGGHSVVLCAFCGQNFETATAGFQVIPAPTATFTCEQMQNCTSTPTSTSPPTATHTCQELQNCTPTPSATDSATPIGFVASKTPSPSAVPTNTATATSTPVPTSTPTTTPTPAGLTGWIGRVGETVGGFFGRIGEGLGIVTRTPTPVPVDIELVKIEITQGIQCLNNPDCADNSVTLYERRPTLVRAYVRLNSGPAFINNVSATLCFGSVYDRGCPFPVRPLAPVTVERAVSDPVSFFRGNLKATLNFIVPADWIDSPKSLFLTVNVNPGGERAPETDYDNNNVVESFTFARRRRMDIVFVPFYSNGAIATYDDRWPIVSWLQLAYPTNDIRVWTTGYWLVKDYAFNDLSGGGCGKGWSGVLDSLEWFRGKNWQIYYGMIDNKSVQAGSPGGCGRYDAAFVSAGRSGLGDRRPGETAAQEVGHNFERHHAPGFGAGNPDGGFPTSDGTLDEYGVDIVRMQIYRPGIDFDFMGYGGDEATKWTSLYTWRALEAQFPLASLDGGLHVASPADRLVAESDFLVANGWLTPEAVTIDDGFFRLRLPADSKDTLREGPYELDLVAADGTVLRSRAFGPASDSNEDPGTGGGFLLREPWVEGTSAVVIRYQGTELARRTLSAHPPTVHLLQPNGGEVWGPGEQTIQWQASDADGDALQSMIEYSLDDGSTWQTIGMPRGATSLTLDTSFLPGTQAARVRVVVSDGLQTASDASDAPFTVADKSPDVFITSVEDGQRLTQGTPLILMAAGSDPEDGPVADEAFRWTSDRDGSLGGGGFLTSSSLSLGEHTLTLEATDRQGQVGRHSVNVFVDPPASPEEPGGTRVAGTGLLLLLAGLVLVGGSGVGLMVTLRRRRRG